VGRHGAAYGAAFGTSPLAECCRTQSGRVIRLKTQSLGGRLAGIRYRQQLLKKASEAARELWRRNSGAKKLGENMTTLRELEKTNDASQSAGILRTIFPKYTTIRATAVITVSGRIETEILKNYVPKKRS
jgi:hypothetical protein